MIQQSLTIDDADATPVDYYLPESGEGPFPVFLYSHGFDNSKELNESLIVLRDAVLKNNMAFVAYDGPSFGSNTIPRNEFTYGRWVDSVEGVVQWIKKQPWAISGKIGSLGISSGTTANLRYAVKSDDLAWIISIATCSSTNVGMNDSLLQKFALSKLHDTNEVAPSFGGRSEGEKFWWDFVAHSPIYNLKDISCPVFFLTGTHDGSFRRGDAWSAYQDMLYRKQSVKYLELEGGDHSLDNRAQERADLSIEWLKEIGFIE